MRKLTDILSNETLSTEEMKKSLRKILLLERKTLEKKTHPWNWGQKQFFRALELLKIKDLDELNKKFQVACYFPIQAELDLRFLSNSNWIFPHAHQGKELHWFEYGDGVQDYAISKHGIPEKKEEHCFSYEPKDKPLLCFVPALACSKNGYRLGYGGGYYDKFLEKWGSHILSVVCLPSEDFLFDELPIDDHDHRVDAVIF